MLSLITTVMHARKDAQRSWLYLGKLGTRLCFLREEDSRFEHNHLHCALTNYAVFSLTQALLPGSYRQDQYERLDTAHN